MNCLISKDVGAAWPDGPAGVGGGAAANKTMYLNKT